MIFKDYYKILGFDTNKVSQVELRNAYREKAKKYHPDINNTKDNSSTEEIFKDINEAYRILSNTRTRRKYDFSWNRYIGRAKRQAEHEPKKSIKEIIISMFFGNVVKKEKKKELLPQYGEDINTQLNVTIEEAFFGVGKKLKLKDIKGKENTFLVKVPAGIQNHDKVRIVGQGKKGKNGGKNGDLIIDINIVDGNNLSLKGLDLETTIGLKMWEASLGTTKKINVLGETLNILVPAGTSSDNILKIENKGYKNGRGVRGDLIIKFTILAPTKVDEKGTKLLNDLKALNY